MALATNALTTVAVMLDELGLTSDSGAQDARLERYINAASALIERYCDRLFYRSDAIVEEHPPGGWTTIRLRRVPAITITTVTINDGEIGSDDYELRDVRPGVPGQLYRPAGWPWSASTMPGITGGPVAGTEKQTVEVTYDGGWVTPRQVADAEFATRTLPHDLEDACVQLVTTRWKGRGRDRAIVAQGLENQSMTFGGIPIPIEILGVLDGYALIPNA